MNQVNLLRLREHVCSLAEKNKDYLFHDVNSYMAELLGFTRKRNLYAGCLPTGSYVAYNFRYELEVGVSEHNFVSFLWQRKLIRNNEWLKTETHYPDASSFCKGIYKDCFLMSNSNLGLDSIVIQHYQLQALMCSSNREFTKNPLELAFDQDLVVQRDNLFYLHPKFLYSLVEKDVARKQPVRE